MINENTNKELISLWFGTHSQNCAFSYYSLQADQIFNEEDDPVEQGAIWRNLKFVEPRAIIFDTSIPRLSSVREVNNRKMLEKMKSQQNEQNIFGMFGNIDAKPLQNYDPSPEQEWPKHENWKDTESHYVLVDKNYTTLPKEKNEKYTNALEYSNIQIFEEFYQRNSEQSEERIRKVLEKCDHLKGFTLCADVSFNGFMGKTIEYLREECPKQNLFVVSINDDDHLPIYNIAKIYEEVDIIVPLDFSIDKFNYFANGDIYDHYAPLISSLFTPLSLKTTNVSSYIESITCEGRKIFNAVYTLPIIDTKSSLNPLTNIFRYEEHAWKQLHPEQQWDLCPFSQKKEEKPSKNQEKTAKIEENEEKEEEEQLKLNFTNNSYLSFGLNSEEKVLSESYILKGHFNDIEKLFTPKPEPCALSMKYLEAVFSNPSILQYSPLYHAEYTENVEAYPFHTLMLAHESFGNGIRGQLYKQKKEKKGKHFNEEYADAEENILRVADMYKREEKDEDDY